MYGLLDVLEMFFFVKKNSFASHLTVHCIIKWILRYILRYAIYNAIPTP